MLTGNLGKEGAGVNPLRGQNNVQGACDMGGLPNVLPGYKPVTDEAARKVFEEAWGVKLPDKPGLTMIEMLNAAEKGEIKALYIMGENPALSDPNLNHTRHALEKCEFLVVQDIFMTETAEFADVVLPGASFAEKDGTFTNTERRVSRVRQALTLPGQARQDWQIIQDLSNRMGYAMKYDSPRQILEEINQLVPQYAGITWYRIEKKGIQWPCPDTSHPGTEFLHQDKFTRGKGKFHPTPFIESAELPDKKYPLLLTTGRQLYHFHTSTMTGRVEGLEKLCPGGSVEINPEDAAGLEIMDGEKVEVASRRGKVEAMALVTDRVPQGTIFMPFHFAAAPANMLTNDALDPTAKIPELKVCAAAVRKVA
jgi:predicted molibdopterin-dependent oxidoreductase YjgC